MKVAFMKCQMTCCMPAWTWWLSHLSHCSICSYRFSAAAAQVSSDHRHGESWQILILGCRAAGRITRCSGGRCTTLAAAVQALSDHTWGSLSLQPRQNWQVPTFSCCCAFRLYYAMDKGDPGTSAIARIVDDQYWAASIKLFQAYGHGALGT